MNARAPRPVATLLVVVLAACGQSPASQPSIDPTDEVPVAPGEAEPPARPDGPPGLPEEAIAALVAYGAQHADTFGGLYIDPPGGRSVVMLFTGDLAEHELAVNEILPGTRVRQVRFTEAERVLQRAELGRELFGREGIELMSTSVDVIRNVVEVALKSDDPTLEQVLEAAHPGMVDASVFPFAGPWANVEAGDGWRLLAAGAQAAEAYNVRAATTAEEWDALWDAISLDGDQPVVDLDSEVVVSFGHGLSQSCPELRLDAVEVEDATVYSVTSDPLAPRSCTLDLSTAAVFVVALERAALPDDGFIARLSREGGPGPCPDCGFTPVLEVDLP